MDAVYSAAESPGCTSRWTGSHGLWHRPTVVECVLPGVYQLYRRFSSSPLVSPTILQNLHSIQPCDRYGSGTEGFYGYIWNIHTAFPQYPIWVTEYAEISTNDTGWHNYSCTDSQKAYLLWKWLRNSSIKRSFILILYTGLSGMLGLVTSWVPWLN